MVASYLRWRVTGKGYVIKLYELRGKINGLRNYLNHQYTRAVHLIL